VAGSMRNGALSKGTERFWSSDGGGVENPVGFNVGKGLAGVETSGAGGGGG
jgi:hypothetical protein